MPEYTPIECLKTAKQLINFDAICVGGPLHGEFRSLGSLPVQQLTEVIDSYMKSRVGNMRSFPYRLGSHMKYRLSLVRRGLVYLAWLHDSVPCAMNLELLASFNDALEKSETIAPDEAAGDPPFKRHDEVFIRGSSVYQHRAVAVDKCVFRDGKWWFNAIGDPCLREAACYQTYEDPAADDWMDKEDENAAQDATPDPKHKVLSDSEMFGPTDLLSSTGTYAGLSSLADAAPGMLPNIKASELNERIKEWGAKYQIDTSKLFLNSTDVFNGQTPATPAVNRSVAPFRVGQMVRWRSKGTIHAVEAIKYVDAEKCWAIRIAGHDKPYDAAMFEPSFPGPQSTDVAPPADPQPLGARPRRRIIRKERPQ